MEGYCPVRKLTVCRTSPRTLKNSATRRDVFPQTSDPGTSHKTSGTSDYGSLETSGRGCCHGIKPSVYGYEGCREICYYNDKLYAWMHAIER